MNNAEWQALLDRAERAVETAQAELNATLSLIMGMQVEFIQAQAKSVGYCEECGKPFEIKHPRQRYDSERCGSRVRQRRFAQRRPRRPC